MRPGRALGARGSVRRVVALGVLAVAVPVLAVPLLGSDARAGGDARARRVVVVSLPYVTWDDVDATVTPTLERFARGAAVAGLSTRVHRRTTPLGDGYATLGAGTRAVAVADAQNGGLMAEERFGAVTAGDAYRQRTGAPPRGAIVQTAIVGLLGANARLDYDAEVGALGDALARAGVDRVVVANADGEEPDAGVTPLDPTPGPPRQRLAVLGLMDRAGQVARGRVDRGLLLADVDAPFGVRLDPDAVIDAARVATGRRAVVLVEASDLVRVERYAPYATAAEHARQRRAALRDADRLLRELLAEVDLTRDVVMVLGPAHPPAEVALTPLAVQGPGFVPGLLESATTRRAGFVQLHDVAPTVLAALGLEAPTSMEGRAAEPGRGHGDGAARLKYLRDADAAARFRDARIGEVYALLAAVTAVVAVLGLASARDPGSAVRRRSARAAALLALGLLAAAFLVRLGPLHEAGVAGFYAGLLAVGALVATAAALAGRRRPTDALLVALGILVAVLTVDALRGAPLVLNSVLGYSPTVAGRFAGFGNPAYAAYSAAALAFAALAAHRVGGRRGLAVAAGVLAVALVVDVAPMWGSDVGGILSMVPAYALTMLLLAGRRLRVRTALVAVGAVAVVGALATLVDLARPERDRTHLGRFVERLRDDGIGGIGSVVERKLSANLSSVGTSILGLVLLVAVIGAVLWWRRHPDRVREVLHAVPEWRAANVGFVVLAALGFAFNDSGMTVPGIMLVVFVAAWTHLLVTLGAPDRVVTGAPG